MNEIKILKKIGTEVFFEKRKTFDYSTLIHGVVLGPNTYRGFHKIDKSKTGSKEAFEAVLQKTRTLL